MIVEPLLYFFLERNKNCYIFISIIDYEVELVITKQKTPIIMVRT